MTDLARLRIVSDGTPFGSTVEVDGKVLPVRKAVVTITGGCLTTAVLTVDDVDLIVEGRFEEQEREFVAAPS